MITALTAFIWSKVTLDTGYASGDRSGRLIWTSLICACTLDVIVTIGSGYLVAVLVAS